MKKIHILALSLALTLPSFGQYGKGDKQDPMDRAAGIGEESSMTCTTLDEAPQRLNCGGVIVDLHQFSSNKLLPVYASPKEKKYLYEVGETGLKLTNLWIVDSSTLGLEVRYAGPNASNIAGQARRVNPFLNGLGEEQLNPVCMLGYEISYPGAIPDRVDCGAFGCSIEETINAILVFPSSKEARIAYDAIIAGKSFIELRYAIGRDNLAGFAKVSADQERIFNSKAYRELISPVAGKTISVFQAYVATAAVRMELRSDVTLGGIIDQLAVPFSDAWKELIGFERKIPLDFEEAAALQLTNLDNNRFATDIIRRLSEDMEKKDEDEWCLKFREEYKRQIEDAKKSNTSGSGGVNILGIKIGFSGGGGSSYDRRFLDHLEKLLAQEDCGSIRNYLKESFVFEGEKYIPKGIYATEFTQSFSEIHNRHFFLGRFYKFEVRQQTRRLKYKP